MSLVRAFDEAKGALAKTHEFTIAGEKVSLPRLNLRHQALFEKWMRKHVGGDFSLSLTSNKAAFKYASLVQGILNKTKAQYSQEELQEKMSPEQRAELESQIRDGLEPYLETLMSKFDAASQQYAIYLAFKQGFGSTYKDEDGEFDVTEENVGTLLENTTNAEKNNTTLFVLGLQDWVDDMKTQAETGDELLEERLGDPLESEKEQSENSTTKSSSRSSQPTGKKTQTGSGTKPEKK